MTEKEYNICVTNYADNVFRFIIKNIRHEEDARDIVQTAFEKMWKNREQVENEKAKSFLFTVAYNQMIDHIRKNKKVIVANEVTEDYKVGYQPNFELRKKLNAALNTLSDLHKSLVLLKDYEGYNYDEIGKITGLKESQVKVYLHRARIQLKEYLGSIEQVL
ncbi:MAG: RNA polymerase sigma factor [Chitinophagaceae bacterium]|jgi:RNA polymerase sigma factor (sigma-70 family)